MLTRKPGNRPALGDVAGFTLIEMIVAMLCGIIITGALFAILEVSLRQTQRTTGRVQATQLGRSAMTRVVDELHSACIAKEFKPIQEKSSENELIFISGTGEEAVLTKAYKHKISFSSSEGLLTEETWASSGGEWPNFEFKSTPTKTRVGEFISQSGSTPIFQYYNYAEKSGSSSTSAVSTLSTTPLEAKSGSGLTATHAEETAGVLITFTAGAPEGKQYKPTVELNDQVTLAFSAPSAETPIKAAPCE